MNRMKSVIHQLDPHRDSYNRYNKIIQDILLHDNLWEEMAIDIEDEVFMNILCLYDKRYLT